MLGHTDIVIDILKFEMEGHEWVVLNNTLQDHSIDNVKQLMFEIHTDAWRTYKKESIYYYSLLLKLEQQGFRRFWGHNNIRPIFVSPYTGHRQTQVVELYYIDIWFLHKYYKTSGNNWDVQKEL